MAEPSQNRERARPFRGNRQYFRWATPVGSAKARLSILLFLASLGWVAVAATSRERRNNVCTHGPISKAHAPWADQCDACHVPFDGEKAGLFETRERWNTFRCETCHAGPANTPKVYAPHQQVKANGNSLNAEDCSFCHKDHQGVDFALAQPSDAACTQCHADMKMHHTGTPGTPGVPDINDFATHPNFRVLSYKPEKIRSLKFDHAKHMAARPGAGGAATLTCNSCHTPDAEGKAYLPVTYDRHCASCHDLTVGEKDTCVAVDTCPFPVPHKVTASQLRDQLGGEFLSQLTGALPDAVALERKPGQRLDPPVPRVAADVRAEVDRLTADTLKELLGAGTRYCQKCHVADSTAPMTLKKTDIHQVWLPAARFAHSKHRALDCAGCHAGKATPLKVKAQPEPPDIPGIDNCRTCHAPAGKTTQGQPLGGVRHGCVDCHTYHHGDRRGLLGADDLLRGLPRDTPR